MKGKTTFLAKAFLMLFAVLLSAAGAKAQQAIPYSYGFEDNDLATDGWVLQGATSSSTGIFAAAKQNGSYGFRFNYSEQNAYLLSPVLTGTDKGVEVTFYYTEYSTSYGAEQFQVGYTTDETATDASTFTYGDIIDAATTTWEKYTQTFPAGTKRIAVKYIYNDIFYLFLDDFTFDVPATVAKPTGLKVSYTSGTEAIVSWSSDESLFDIDVNGTVTEDVENPYTLTGLAYETEYTVMVRAKKDGEVSKWSDPVSFTTGVQFPAPTDVAASDVTANTANISWNGTADSYNLRYKVSLDVKASFEDNTLDGWTTIDADGDGYDWVLSSATNGIYLNNNITEGYNGSSAMIVSGSYSNLVGALTPDNWLVSPKIILGGSISFWAKGQDANYAEEVFGVAVSTTGNTDPADFTMVGADKTATGDWVRYTFDLSGFSGNGYVAIRHYNISDMFMLDVDDITIIQPSDEPWTTVNNVTSPYTIEGLTPETAYVVEVQAVYADGESAWASTIFTTAEDVATPSDLAASDVTKTSAVLTWTENGEATAWEIMLNDDEENLISADSNPFTLTGLTPETAYTAKVRAVNGEKTSKWSNAVSFTTLIAFPAPTDLAADNITVSSATISWTNDDAEATGAELQYAVSSPLTDVKTLSYDDGTYTTAIGNSTAGNWVWGVMYPGSMVKADAIDKISIYETSNSTEDITIYIYQGGDYAPSTLVHTETVTPEGANAFHDVKFDMPVAITPEENLWIILQETGTYVMAASSSTEANNQWVYSEGWANIGDLASSLASYGWMIRADVGTQPELTWTTVADATSPAELTGLTPGTTYAVRVKSIYGTDGESKWAYTSFTTVEENPVPSNIAAELAADGAVLTWEGKGDSYNVRYRQAGTNGETYFEDDLSTLDNWTVVTAGEGPGWTITDEAGANAATAYSYDNGTNTAWNADNWLISPAVELGGKVTFSVNTSTSFPDSYEVLLSTTGTETTDFTTTLQAMAAATPGQVSIDLSAYSGTGHIAIHHVSTDCYLLIVYDFNVYGLDVPTGEWTELTAAEATATLSGLATNNAYEYQVQSVKDGSTSEWSAADQFALLTLANDADNKSNINKFEGMTAHVTLADRTIYTDGTWNTITLPFNLTPEQLAASPLAGADVRTLTSNLTVSEESVTLNFTEEGAIESAWGQYYGGVPYIFKIDGTGTISNPEFAGVTIARYLNPMTGSDATSGISITFEPTYAPINFTSDDTSVLYVGSDNKLVYPLAGASIGACRGYFDLTGVTAEEASGVKILTNLDDEDATGIAGISNAKENGEWYDLSGRKLAGKPAQKGIYVNGGRKVTLK